jgi:hypothetical protein
VELGPKFCNTSTAIGFLERDDVAFYQLVILIMNPIPKISDKDPRK